MHLTPQWGSSSWNFVTALPIRLDILSSTSGMGRTEGRICRNSIALCNCMLTRDEKRGFLISDNSSFLKMGKEILDFGSLAVEKTRDIVWHQSSKTRFLEQTSNVSYITGIWNIYKTENKLVTVKPLCRLFRDFREVKKNVKQMGANNVNSII